MDTFHLPGSAATASHGAVVADFDVDGLPDLALLADAAAPVRIALRQEGNSTLGPLAQPLAAVQAPSRALAADFDEDGDPDLLVTCACTGTDRTTLYLNAWSQKGTVGFAPMQAAIGLPAPSSASIPLALDYDSDGDTDLLLLATRTASADSVLLLNTLRQSQFGFIDQSSVLPSGLTDVTAAAVLDANDDGRPDVYIGRAGPHLLLVQQSDGRYRDEATLRGIASAGAVAGIAAADLDLDGGQDLVLLDPNGTVAALLRKAGARFGSVALGISVPASAGGLGVADLLGDRHPEIVVTSAALPGGATAFAYQQMVGGAPSYAPLVGSSAIRGGSAGAPGVWHAGFGRSALGINAGNGEDAVLCVVSTLDRDADRIPDGIERDYGLNPENPADAKEDPDADGVPNREELLFAADPHEPDSDRDGIRDDQDLLLGTDFDGDGIPYRRDNCPKITNRKRDDSNANRVGDACDRDPAQLKTFHEARHGDGVDRALLAARQISASRLTGDQKGLLPQGPSFRLLKSPIAGRTRPVIELWHPESRDHAYAVLPGDVQTLMVNGYRRLGPIGFLYGEQPKLPGEIQLRNFRLNGVRPDHAVTADPAVAKRLGAEGYVEGVALGWALRDEGRFSVRTKAVVRYSGGPRSMHSSRLAGDMPTGSMRSGGVVFRVMPEQSGWTIPLYRFRTLAGAEVLSTEPSEFEDFERRGYRLEGVIGWIFPMTPVQTTETLVPLVRFNARAGDRFAQTADPAEMRGFVRDGFGRMKILGRVAKASAPRPPASAAAIFTRALNGIDDPRQRAAATLGTLVVACTLERVLRGAIDTPFEQRMANITAGLDAETRDRLLAQTRVWHDLDPRTRAAALGALVGLDPGACSVAIDVPLVRLAIAYTMETPTLAPVFGATLRAPQCLGGATADPRAVSVVERAILQGDVSTVFDYAVKPRLLGVRGDSASTVEGVDDLANDPLFAYQVDHAEVGFPLIGVDKGPCAAGGQCPAVRGEMCVAGRCRSYPFIKEDGTPTFTGVSFWDKFGALVLFSPVGGGDAVAAPVEMVGNTPFVFPDPARLPARCDPEPARMDANIRSPRTPEVIGPGQVTGVSSLYQRRPNEASIDIATTVPVHLPPNRFYDVQIINQNGNYYFWNDQIDFAQDPRGKGHVVHVCAPPGCTPTVNRTEAACEKAPNALCAATAGGVWSQQPRPLANCAGNSCPETPSDFRSDAAIGSSPALPLRVFVPQVGKQQFLNARLTHIACLDETGWDAFGEDELVVILGAAANPFQAGIVPDMPKSTDVADLGNRIDAWSGGFDSDDSESPLEFLSSLSFPMHPFDKGKLQSGIYVLQVGEDDDNIAQMLIAGVLGAAASLGAGLLFPPAGVAAGVVTAAIVGAIAATDPDDFIGQHAWEATVAQVIAAGNLSHDSDPLAPVPMLPTIPGASEHLRGWGAMTHPAVDGANFTSETQLKVCTAVSDCDAGHRCADRVCMPQEWLDPTEGPLNSAATKGSLEFYFFNGSGAKYNLRFAFSVSDRKALPHER